MMNYVAERKRLIEEYNAYENANTENQKMDIEWYERKQKLLTSRLDETIFKIKRLWRTWESDVEKDKMEINVRYEDWRSGYDIWVRVNTVPSYSFHVDVPYGKDTAQKDVSFGGTSYRADANETDNYGIVLCAISALHDYLNSFNWEEICLFSKEDAEKMVEENLEKPIHVDVPKRTDVEHELKVLALKNAMENNLLISLVLEDEGYYEHWYKVEKITEKTVYLRRYWGNGYYSFGAKFGKRLNNVGYTLYSCREHDAEFKEIK